MNKIIDIKQQVHLIRAIFLETVREPAVLFWGIVFPILMSLGLGFAFSKKTDVVRKVAVIEIVDDQNTTNTSFFNDYLKKNTRIDSSGAGGYVYYKAIIPNEKLGNTTFLFKKTDWKDAMILLKRGNVNVVLKENQGKIEYHFDPTNPDAQLTYLKLKKLFNTEDVIVEEDVASIKPLTVVGTRYIDFLVPGLMGMGIMMSCMWGISYGFIEKRSKKLLRRLVATPMKKSHFLIALITVRMGMNFIENVLLFLFAYLVFGFTIQGSVIALLLIFLAGNFAFSGIAVFISSRTSKTEIGNGMINVVVMPMMVLSGVFFSYHNFPDWTIPIIQKLPLTMMADDMRSVFIEGAGLKEVYLNVMILASTGLLFFTAGLKIFKWH